MIGRRVTEVGPETDDLPRAAHLLSEAGKQSSRYAIAEPYPNAVLDGLFPPATLERVLDEFAYTSQQQGGRREFSNRFEKKYAFGRIERWGPWTRRLMAYLNSRPFLTFLEALTSIESLLADPDCVGGGLHEILPGGYLKIHADFNKHPRTRWHRRLNVLLYLNKDWDERWGGHLELWDSRMARCVKQVLPTFNRLAVFSTTDTAYHGHPDPLQCPPGRSRKSLALYYYTRQRPAGEIHQGFENHTTLYRARPGEALRQSRLLYWYSRLRSRFFT